MHEPAAKAIVEELQGLRTKPVTMQVIVAVRGDAEGVAGVMALGLELVQHVRRNPMLQYCGREFSLTTMEQQWFEIGHQNCL